MKTLTFYMQKIVGFAYKKVNPMLNSASGPKFLRRYPRHFSEYPAEVGQIIKSHLHGDPGYGLSVLTSSSLAFWIRKRVTVSHGDIPNSWWKIWLR